MTQTHIGRCLCGAIRYTATGAPIIVARCHCQQCRRTSGTSHATGAMFLASAVSFTGSPAKTRYTSAKGSEVTKAFCPTCGSPIYGTNSSAPEHLTLSLGTMDDASDLDIQVVLFQRDKPHWDELGADVTAYQTQPNWTPDA